MPLSFFSIGGILVLQRYINKLCLWNGRRHGCLLLGPYLPCLVTAVADQEHTVGASERGTNSGTYLFLEHILDFLILKSLTLRAKELPIAFII